MRTICCLVFGSWLVLSEDDVMVGMPAGLPVEERSAEEELEGALVHLKAQLLVLLHRGGPQGLPGEHHSGRELLCGGTTQHLTTPLTSVKPPSYHLFFCKLLQKNKTWNGDDPEL